MGFVALLHPGTIFAAEPTAMTCDMEALSGIARHRTERKAAAERATLGNVPLNEKELNKAEHAVDALARKAAGRPLDGPRTGLSDQLNSELTRLKGEEKNYSPQKIRHSLVAGDDVHAPPAASDFPGAGGESSRTLHNQLAAWLAKPSTDGNSILSFLEQDEEARALLAKSAGVQEGYTVKEHTLRVYGVFADQLASSGLKPVQIGGENVDLPNLLKFTIALHDIGKGSAAEAGNVSLQHKFTIPILEKNLQKFGFSRKETEIASALVDNDILGAMVKNQLSVEDAQKSLTEIAQKVGMQPADFFTLESLFYRSDAASYPQVRENYFFSAGGRVQPNNPKFQVLARDFQPGSLVRDTGAPKFLAAPDARSGVVHLNFSAASWATDGADPVKKPPILSVVRALNEASQYDLKILPEDWEKMRQIAGEFNPKAALGGGDDALLDSSVKKIFTKSSDIERSWNMLDELGLRKKFEEIKGDTSNRDSMAWMLNKEPLRSYPLGQLTENDPRARLQSDLHRGKTAKELGLDVVSHETSYEGFESITSSPVGKPNIVISRAGAVGEAVTYGDGAYFQVGKDGGRGVGGAVVRCQMAPDAVEGIDFRYEQKLGILVVLNANAITLMPEGANLSMAQYLDRIAAHQQFTSGDAVRVEKNKVAIMKSLEADPAEFEALRARLKAELAKKWPNGDLVKEAVSFVGDRLDPELMSSLVKFRGEARVDTSFLSTLLPDDVLKNPKIAKTAQVYEALAPRGGARVLDAAAGDPWIKGPELLSISLAGLQGGRAETNQAANIIHLIDSHPEWSTLPNYPSLVEALIRNRPYDTAPETLQKLKSLAESIPAEPARLEATGVYQSEMRASDFASWLNKNPVTEATLQKSPELRSHILAFSQDRNAVAIAAGQQGRDNGIAAACTFVLSQPDWQNEKSLPVVKALASRLLSPTNDYVDAREGDFFKVMDSSPWLSTAERDSLLSTLLNEKPERLSGRKNEALLEYSLGHWLSRAGAESDPAARSAMDSVVVASKKGMSHPERISVALAKDEWAKPENIGLLKEWLSPYPGLYQGGSDAYSLSLPHEQLALKAILNQPAWIHLDGSAEVFQQAADAVMNTKISQTRQQMLPEIFQLLRSEDWIKNPAVGGVLETLMKDPDIHWQIAREVLSQPKWADTAEGGKILLQLIDARRADGDIVRYVLAQPAWANNPHSAEFIQRLIGLGTVNGDIDQLLSQNPAWRDQAGLRALCHGAAPSVELLRGAFPH